MLAENEKLVKEFGASRASSLKEVPDCYTFTKGLIYSHRDFDKFFAAVKKKEKCAILSGLNASGTLHLGHKAVFDTNLYFQKEFGLPVFIPISDDESYVAGKVATQEEGLANAKKLAKQLLAYGFDPEKTFFIIDQVFTNIYNLAFTVSRKVNYSEVKATYGYKPEENIGLHFYPAVQSAHILFPQVMKGYKHVLVPIGPDEDAHFRISRDVASRMNLVKPAALHITFIPGPDKEKMSKSRKNAVFFEDDEKTIQKKVKRAFSGGKETIEAHRKHGGNPDIDMAYQYLDLFFLDEKESARIRAAYEKGEILSGEMKELLAEALVKFTKDFQDKVKKTSDKTVEKCILKNR